MPLAVMASVSRFALLSVRAQSKSASIVPIRTARGTWQRGPALATTRAVRLSTSRTHRVRGTGCVTMPSVLACEIYLASPGITRPRDDDDTRPALLSVARKAVRKTKQQEAIRSVFQSQDRPLSPEEVRKLASSSPDTPNIGLATVYRHLKALVESRTLSAVGIPGQPLLYELTNPEHHHHFQCDACQRVYDVHACPGHLKEMAPEGFQVESHSITLYGLCADCHGASE